MHTHPHHHHPAPPVLRLDGVEIPAAEIAAEMRHHPAETAVVAWQQAAEALVIRRLLLAEADRENIRATPDPGEMPEEARIRRLIDIAVPVREPDEATCRRWFDANPARFRSRPAWQAAHILLAADPADSMARARARDAAELALEAVQRDPGSLSSLARALSACPSRAEDGNLGVITPGSTVPEFEAALAVTPAGAVHEKPVETRYGFHVLRVLARTESRAMAFEDARPRIEGWLTEAAWRQAARHYMLGLASRSEIEGLVLSACAGGPLVQ